jgi:hypothetical protein
VPAVEGFQGEWTSEAPVNDGQVPADALVLAPSRSDVPSLPTTDGPFAVAIAESFEVKDGLITKSKR